jgi:hypothetical protein
MATVTGAPVAGVIESPWWVTSRGSPSVSV